MQTATYIDVTTREAVRARSMSYIETDVAPGLTLAAHRRLRHGKGGSASRVARVMAAVSHLSSRYPDDPVGNYETTDGGW
jgi:hypothetical protein